MGRQQESHNVDFSKCHQLEKFNMNRAGIQKRGLIKMRGDRLRGGVV